MWNLNDITPPDDEAIQAEREMWETIAEREDAYAPLATESEAHAEWHRNSGVPMGQPGCPQDACHPDDEYDDYVPAASFKRLRTGAWGVTGASALLQPDARVEVVKRSGERTTVTVGRVLWSDADTAIATIRR